MPAHVLFFFGIAAAVVALVEGCCYILSIVGLTPWLRKMSKDKWTVPSLAAWTIISVEGFIVALSYYKRHDMNDFWFFAAFTVEYMIAAILSIWYGEHRLPPESGEQKPPIFSRLDWVCLGGAGASLLVWYQLGSWEIPIAMNIAIDFFGIVLVIEKVWRLPNSEDLRSWILTVVGSALAVAALGHIDLFQGFDRAGFPLYFLGINATVLILLLRRYPLVRRLFRF